MEKSLVDLVREYASLGFTREQIADKLNDSYQRISVIIRKNDIHVKRKRLEIKRREDIEILVREGLSLQEIGNKVGMTKEGIGRLYVDKTGQSETYKVLRQSLTKKAKKNAVKSLISILKAKILQTKIPFDDNWATLKAVQYQNTYKSGFNPKAFALERLIGIFEMYKAVKEGKERHTLEEIGGEFGTCANAVRIIFLETGLPVLNYTPKFISEWKKEAIKRATTFSEMTKKDIAYFLDIDYGAAQVRFQILNQTGVKRESLTGENDTKFENNYTFASKVYESFDAGFTDPKDISEIVGIKELYVESYLKNRTRFEPMIISALRKLFPDSDIDKPYLEKNVKEKKDNLVDIVREYASLGFTREQIADKLNDTYQRVSFIIRKNDISVKRKTKVYPDIEKLANGHFSLDKIGSKVGITGDSVRHCLIRTNQYETFKQLRTKHASEEISKRREDIDILARDGLSLEEIGNNVGLTREGVRLYLKRTGQAETYNILRKSLTKGAKENAAKSLISIIKTRIQEIKIPFDNEWPKLKAVQYRSSLSGDSVPIDKLELIFGMYKEVKDGKAKYSLKDIEKSSGVSMSAVGRIIARANLPSLNYKVKPNPKFKIDAVRRSFTFNEMSAQDLAYFLGLKVNYVFPFFRYHNQQLNRKKLGGEIGIDYKTGSQVYEAKDAGFTTLETSQLLNLPPVTVFYLEQNEHKFRPKIVTALRKLLPDLDIDKPYLESRL